MNCVRMDRGANPASTAAANATASAEEVRSVTDRLAAVGYLEWRGLLPAAMLARVNETITRGRRPGFEHSIADDVAELVEELRAFAPFARVEAMARAATLAAHPEFPALATGRDTGSFHVLRCVDASAGWTSHRRHFDSHLMTILIHLQTPGGAHENGDLVVYPHRRHVRGSFVNLLQKTRTKLPQGLPLWWRRATTRFDLRRGRAIRLAAVAGDIHVFNGFASMHCNLSVDSGERRALMLHDYDPGLAFGLSAYLRARRRRTSSPELTRRVKVG